MHINRDKNTYIYIYIYILKFGFWSSERIIVELINSRHFSILNIL
ncbi:hypothetical protein ACMBCM_05645 [Spiroplasma sp. K1]